MEGGNGDSRQTHSLSVSRLTISTLRGSSLRESSTPSRVRDFCWAAALVTLLLCGVPMVTLAGDSLPQDKLSPRKEFPLLDTLWHIQLSYYRYGEGRRVRTYIRLAAHSKARDLPSCSLLPGSMHTGGTAASLPRPAAVEVDDAHCCIFLTHTNTHHIRSTLAPARAMMAVMMFRSSLCIS